MLSTGISMVAAAQLGVLAACIVLFVPMGMAGWHLSRNKMLFFSGALFITLAVSVHIAPYFPAASHFLISSLSHSFPSPPPFPPISCLSLLHNISFSPPRAPSSFRWLPSAACAFRKLSPSEAGELFNGSWIVVAGDSQARLFMIALLRLLLDRAELEAAEGDLFRRHSDYHVVIAKHGIKLDFIWSPFEANITSVLEGIRGGLRLPEVVVAGSGLWHMLHVNNASDYGESLVSLRKSAAALIVSPTLLPHMFWLGMPTLLSSMLNSEEKRERMGGAVWEAYEQEVDGSGVLRRSGGAFLLLDIGSLSRRCGRSCTNDGMHYGGVVYEAALQVMLNALLIESQQQI